MPPDLSRGSLDSFPSVPELQKVIFIQIKRVCALCLLSIFFCYFGRCTKCIVFDSFTYSCVSKPFASGYHLLFVKSEEPLRKLLYKSYIHIEAGTYSLPPLAAFVCDNTIFLLDITRCFLSDSTKCFWHEINLEL